MKKFFLAVTIIMGLVLTLDVIAYPNFVLGKLGVSSAWGLFGYTVLGLLGSIRWRFLPEKVIAWNKRFVFPVLAVVCSCLIVLELTHYPNYVYSLFRIDLFAFSYLTLFSGILLYLFAGDYARKIPGFYIGMPLGLMSMLVIVLVSPDWFVWIVQEDGVIEYFQFGLYCVSCLFATKLALYFKRDNQIWLAVVFGILAFGLFFVSGEEISWGQRVLGIETPESIKEVNLQDEITLHNLDYFQHPLFFDMSYLHFAYTSVGLYGAFSRWIGVFIFP